MTGSGARRDTERGLPGAFAVGFAFFRKVGESGAFFATLFRIVLTLLTLFLPVALLTGFFLRFALALPLAFFLVAIAASRTLTALESLHPIVAE